MDEKVYSPGSWPNAETRAMSDDELLALTSDKIKQLMCQNMRELLRACDGNIDMVSSGEPGLWQDWIRIPASIKLRRVLRLPEHDGKEYQTYFDAVYRDGRKIDSALVPAMAEAMGYSAWAVMAYDVLKEIRAEFNLPGLKLLVGIPFPFDMGMLTGMYVGGTAFEKATAREITKILQAIPADEVVFSLEMPITQVFVAAASMFGLGGYAGKRAANGMHRLVGWLPKHLQDAAKFNLHPCWGDLGNKAVMEVMLAKIFGRVLPAAVRRALCRKLQSVKNIVRLVRPLIETHGDQIDTVHLPFGAGTQSAPTNPETYRPLLNLCVHGIRYSGGFTHEDLFDADVRNAVQAARKMVGDDFFTFIGPRCGLGRCTPWQAKNQVMQALAASR